MLGPTTESLSPPEEPEATDAEVVEHEWEQAERKLLALKELFPIAWVGGNTVIDQITSSLQTIRELTEVKQ